MNTALVQLEKTAVSPGAARIFVVEDERIVARSLQKQLTALGYDVVGTAASGAEAVRQTGDMLPDLVIMDISLEGPMDGVAAAAIIRQRFRLPVVYLTAFSSQEIVERAKMTEPLGYILKPYAERELQVVIETALYKHQMERIRLEQFRRLTKLEATGRLAGGLAHALNNLLTTILGHSEIMLDSLKPGDSYFASTREILKSGQQAAKLVHKLLAYSRQQLLTLQPVDLNAIVAGLAKGLQYLGRGVELKWILEPALARTRADPQQLQEALLTLARNACEAMPHGGQLTIQTSHVKIGQDDSAAHPEVRPGEYVMLAVSDTGRGLDQAALDHLFEPFNTQEMGVGAGMGLSAAYGFVKQCGGDIEVCSQPNQGTTIRIYLPRLPD